MTKVRWWRAVSPYLLVGATTALAWMLRGTLTLANFTIVFLLVVLTIAVERGTLPALINALIGFLVINFFLIQPYYTFAVADPRELLDLVVFFAAAVAAGQLGASEREQRRIAERRASEQEILFRLTRAFNESGTDEAVRGILTHAIIEDFGAQSAHILPGASETLPPDQTATYVLLQTGDHIYGTLRAVFPHPLSADQERLIGVSAALAAAALQRVALATQAMRSQQLEESDRLKTAILRAASHDLRTPITIIRSSVDNLLRLDSQLPQAERLDILHAIEDEAVVLDDLIANLLDLSRLNAGALHLNCQPNSLEEIAGDVAARAFQRTRRERLHLDFPDDLPLIPFDYGLILQAVYNVVDNAIRYEPEDSQVILRGRFEDGKGQMQVINHGRSIPPEERDKIMQAFYTGQGGRIGLGLPIARGIVEAHRGTLHVEDTPGGGATFVISLPMEQPCAQPSALPTDLPQVAQPPDEPTRTEPARSGGGEKMS